MGIRIQKVMGWGMIYSADEFRQTIIRPYPAKYRENRNLAEYKSFLEEKYGKEKEEVRLNQLVNIPLEYLMRDTTPFDKITPYEVCDTVDYSSGNAETQTLLILTPVSQVKEWNRSDDDIDYNQAIIDSNLTGKEMTTTTVNFLPSAPYPYSGEWMNKKTQQKLDVAKSAEILRVLRFIQEDEQRLAAVDLEKLQPNFDALGVTGFEDMNQSIVPAVPQEIQDLAEWLEFFQNPKEVFNLRPLIATYWE